MFYALKKLFENNNVNRALFFQRKNRALFLKQQLQYIKMSRAYLVASYFMKITELKDQLRTIREVVADRELVMMTLHGLPNSWEPFIQSISGRSKLPKFSRLWANCIQESRLAARNNLPQPYDVENQVFAAHAKRKGRKFERKYSYGKPASAPYQGPRKKKNDISHIQCYKCVKFCHYAIDCTQRKRGKQHASTTHVDEEPPPKKAKLDEMRTKYLF